MWIDLGWLITAIFCFTLHAYITLELFVSVWWEVRIYSPRTARLESTMTNTLFLCIRFYFYSSRFLVQMLKKKKKQNRVPPKPRWVIVFNQSIVTCCLPSSKICFSQEWFGTIRYLWKLVLLWNELLWGLSRLVILGQQWDKVTPK